MKNGKGILHKFVVFLFLSILLINTVCVNAYETDTDKNKMGDAQLQFIEKKYDISKADVQLTGDLKLYDKLTIYRKSNDPTDNVDYYNLIAVNKNMNAGLNNINGTAVLTYRDAAIDSSGTKYPVKFTFSNIKIYTVSAANGPYMVIGNSQTNNQPTGLSVRSMCTNAENLNDVTKYYYGVSVDVEIEVVGAPSTTRYVYGFRDLDVSDHVEYAKGNGLKYATDGSEPYLYQEQVEFLNEDSILSPIYRTTTTKVGVNPGKNTYFGTELSGAGGSASDDYSIYLMANSDIRFRWSGSQCSTLINPVVDMYTIEARTYGEYGKYDSYTSETPAREVAEGGKITDEGVYDIGWHFTKKYDIEANDGYYIKEITVTDYNKETNKMETKIIPITDYHKMSYTFNTVDNSERKIGVAFEKLPMPSKSYAVDTPSGSGGAEVNIGDKIKYNIKLPNIKASKVTVQVKDIISKGLTYNSDAQVTNGTIQNQQTTKNSDGSTTILLTVVINENGLSDLTYSVNVNDNASKIVKNKAIVKYDNDPEIKLNELKNPIKAKLIPIPDTGSVISIVGVITGLVLVGVGSYFVYKKFKKA